MDEKIVQKFFLSRSSKVFFLKTLYHFELVDALREHTSTIRLYKYRVVEWADSETFLS